MSRLDPLAVSRGTDGSNPASSSGESANHRFLSDGVKSAEALPLPRGAAGMLIAGRPEGDLAGQ